jgi:hypothetical protein
MKYIKSFVLIELATMGIHSIAATQEERIEELERIALYEPSDWIDENEVIPTPDDAKKKFNLTDAQLFSDIKTLEKKYSISETNDEKRFCRKMAVSWIGGYGTTNDFPYLKNIMHNKNDYAQEDAMRILIEKTKLTNQLLPLAKEIVTNKMVFSLGLRGLTYVTLADMCNSEYTNTYINSAQIRSNIAAFFLERAGLESDMMLYVDRVACDLNPSYRHSQQRRDNLAKLRPIGLTGEQAEIYDGRQRDALPKEEEE